jgi:hypothetical protein
VRRCPGIENKLGRGWRSRADEPQTVKSAPLHDALKAALELVDNHGKSEGVRTPPLWYYIVAVSAADAKMIDPTHLSMQLRDGAEHRAAVEAYDAAKRALQLLEELNAERRLREE